MKTLRPADWDDFRTVVKSIYSLEFEPTSVEFPGNGDIHCEGEEGDKGYGHYRSDMPIGGRLIPHLSVYLGETVKLRDNKVILTSLSGKADKEIVRLDKTGVKYLSLEEKSYPIDYRVRNFNYDEFSDDILWSLDNTDINQGAYVTNLNFEGFLYSIKYTWETFKTDLVAHAKVMVPWQHKVVEQIYRICEEHIPLFKVWEHELYKNGNRVEWLSFDPECKAMSYKVEGQEPIVLQFDDIGR